MAHEHSPSGSDKYLTGGESAETGVSRRQWLADAMAVGGLLTLSACGAGRNGAGRKTERDRSSDSEEDGRDSDPGGNAPEEENDGEKKYDTYNKLNFDQVYTDVARYDFEGNNMTGYYIKSGWSRRSGKLERVSEPETLPQFTVLELADRYATGEVNAGEIRHWLADVVAAEEHPKVPGLGGLFDDGDYRQDVALIDDVPPPSEWRKKAENIWAAAGVLGQYAQGLALDVQLYDDIDEAARNIDKETYEKVLWLVCCAATSSEKAANKLKMFVSERARNVKSPEQAEECMEWWTTAKLTGAKPILGSYNSENENAPNRRAGRMSVQFFVDPSVNVIGQAPDGVLIASIGGTDRVMDYSDPDY